MRKEKSQAILAGSFKSKTNFLFLHLNEIKNPDSK